jgi:hypothetical protein
MSEEHQAPDEEPGPELKEREPFLRLGDYLFVLNEAPGTIASAIESHGVYTWDRYGRLRKFAPDTPEAKHALDYVAGFYASNCGHPDNYIDHEQFFEAGGDAFGWPVQDHPDLSAIKVGLNLSPKQSTVDRPGLKSENANLGMVLGLLRFIKGELGNTAHQDYKSEAQLAEFIELAMVGYPGVSKSNFKSKFADAKKLIPKTEQ